MKKYTLITGACGGLGREFVKLCLKNRENLMLSGTSEQKLDLLKSDLIGQFGELCKDVDIKTCKCDISNKDDRVHLIDFIKTNEISFSRRK